MPATEVSSTSDTAARARGRNALARSGGPLGGLVVLVLLLSLLSPDFLTANNLINVGVQASVTAILAFGLTFVIVSGGIDLSVGSVAGLSGIVTGWAATQMGMPLWLAIPVGVASGALAGLLTGVLITVGRVPPFIATLAMLSAGRGLALVIADGRPITMGDGWLASFGSGELFGFLPYPVLVLLVIGLLTAFVLRRTYSGRAMYAIGGNAEAARLSGIRVTRQTILVYVLSGTFAAVAGILLASRLASAQPEAGTGYELDAIAAVVIGGASLAGGVGTALGTFLGALILAVLRNGLNLLDVSSFWQQVAIGAVIAAAVLFDTLRRRRGSGQRTPLLRTPAMRRAGAAVAVLLLVAGGWAAVARQQAGDGGQVRVALSLSTVNNPFFVDLREGAQAEADRLGIDLSVTDAQEDASQQANAVQNAIAGSVDALVVNPVDSDAVVPSVRAANSGGIPVIGVDREPSDGKVVTTVASDNVTGGQLAAREIAREVGSGPIGVLEGEPGTSAARERGDGFTRELRKFPEVEVVASQTANFDRTEALDVTTNMLQANPEIKAIFAANDEMALGAVKALGDRAGSQVKIFGFDGTPEGLDAVQSGQLSGVIAQQPKLLGRTAVQQALEAAQSKNTTPGEPTNIPVEVVTRSNLDEFLTGQ